MLDLFPFPGSLPRLNRSPLYLRVYLRIAEGPGRPAVGSPKVVQVGDGLTFFEDDAYSWGRVVKVTSTGVETASKTLPDGSVRHGSKVKFEDFSSIVRQINDPDVGSSSQ